MAKLLLLIVALCLWGAHAATSQLWGSNGSKYNVKGRLLDYSYAGYAAGEANLPSLKATRNIRSYGAKGNGQADDTSAFERAISSANDGAVIYVPAGTYKITRQLKVYKSVSLLGAGSGKTTLLFTRSLAAASGNPSSTAFQASDGFISYEGKNPNQEFAKRHPHIGTVQSGAKRGDNKIKVSSTRGLKVGQWVTLSLASASGSYSPMNLGVDPGCRISWCFGSDVAYTMASRVAGISGNTVTLERPLPWDLYSNMRAQLWTFTPTVRNIGIQGFKFQFNSPRYRGHWTEQGWNAIQLKYTYSSFIRDLVINNADTGIVLQQCNHITVTQVTFNASPKRVYSDPDPDHGRVSGHHGFLLKKSADNVFSNFRFNTRFYHDLSIDLFADRNVFSRGSGVDLNIDNHKSQTYGNLFVQLNAGAAKRVFLSGGGANRGLQAGAYSTFWNIVGTSQAVSPPPRDYGPALNFVGLGQAAPIKTKDINSKITRSWLVERIPASKLSPQNIWEAQRGLRMRSKHRVSSRLGGRGNGGPKLFGAR